MATNQTNIVYGSITLTNVLTRQFSQEAVFDDSGTDLLYFKYTIRGVGYVHNLSAATFGVFPPTGSQNAPDQLAQMHYLFQPRQSFVMTVGGVTILAAFPLTTLGSKDISGKDCNNGPKARVVTVDHIASDQIFRIEFEFEVCQVQCSTGMTTTNTTGVVSNRWSCTDDINEDWYTTRTFSGRLRCSSAMVNPNSFRYLVVPPLQPGMRRDSIQMRISEDGLNLDYNVTDKEIAFSAPAPATGWALRVSERRSIEDIAWYIDVDVTLRGDRSVDKKKLIAIANAIADAKFNGGNAAAQNYCVMSITISDEYSANENSIHFQATAKRLDGNAPAIKGVQAKWIGKPIDANDLAAAGVNNYDSTKSRDGRNGETLQVSGPIPVAGAFACFLQTPCGGNRAISDGLSPTSSGSPSSGSLPAVSAVVVTELPDDGSLSNVDPTNYSNAYTYWRLDSQYSTNQMRAHCPVAATGSSSSGQNTSVVVNLAPPQTKRVIRVIAERIGVIPTLPQPVDQFTDENGISNILLDNNLIASAPMRTPDNKQIFRITGEIAYGLLKAITATSTLRLGFNSWENQSPTYKMIFPEKAE